MDSHKYTFLDLQMRPARSESLVIVLNYDCRYSIDDLFSKYFFANK
jgi:hypothetical protein